MKFSEDKSIRAASKPSSGPCRANLNDFSPDDYFYAIFGEVDVDMLKPERSRVFKCLETTAMELSSAGMIGDHYTDLAAAENTGIKSAFVHYGFGE